MAKNFKELQAKMSPESRTRSEAKAAQLIRTCRSMSYARHAI